MPESHIKVLTRNDTGETGGHQGGIAVPKTRSELISFFPKLDIKDFNPEAWIYCTDQDGETWKFRYVYYNGKLFKPQKSTRNEYRITHMTRLFSKWDAKEGDSIVFTSTPKNGDYKIEILKTKDTENNTKNEAIVLKGWSHVF